MACILALATSGCFATQGKWERSPRSKQTLRGRTFGLVGCGDIGRRVIPLVRAFGMRVQIYDPPAGHDSLSLNELLSTSDYVCLLTPLNTSTYHMIDDKALSCMKLNSCIINTGRGGLIDEDALIRALKRPGGIRGAALDVFELEPLPSSSKLWNLPGVLISPHVAGLTETATIKAATQLVENFDALLRGGTLARVLLASSAVRSASLTDFFQDTYREMPTPEASEVGSDQEK
ncbi:hypothetical protein HDU89_006648 [Geranomyces variabilis]|nr:hypothetical protein HDU89_006648 [Geranomyces variabilis]